MRGAGFILGSAAFLLTSFTSFPYFPSLLAFAADEITILQADFLRGDYRTVLAQSEQLLNRSPAGRQETLLYLQGLSALKLKELQKAEGALLRLLESHPGNEWFLPASLALGEVYAAAGDSPKALALYEQLSRDSRSEPMAPQIQSRMGQLREGSFFTVQLGAFKSRSNAIRMKQELARRGYGAEVSETQMRGHTFYRVRVGTYPTRGEAGEEATRLAEAGFPGKVVP